MDFVWIYAHRYSFFAKSGLFNELDYSIKTVKKFYKNARCWVVGDTPVTDEEVTHIPTELVLTARSPLDRRNVDLMRKLDAILDSDINEEFVLMYDDQYFLRKITKKDLQPTALCRIDDLSKYHRVKGLLYGRLWDNTYKTISEMGVPMYDYETHLPRLMEKEKTRWLMDTHDLRNQNYLIHSLYYTMFAEDPILISEDDTIRSHTWTVSGGEDWDYIFSKKFLIVHDDSCIPQLWDRIKALV